MDDAVNCLLLILDHKRDEEKDQIAGGETRVGVIQGYPERVLGHHC